MNNRPILVRLKEDSRPYHTAAERDLDLFKRSTTADDYGRLLARFYGFFTAMEQAISGIKELEPVIPDIEARKRTPLLRLDLAALGWTGKPIEIAICNDLPAVNSIPSALGSLYVLEGSTLGGQYISRHLKDRLNIDVNSGGRFFHSHGDQVGAMWKAFGTAMTAYSTANADDDAIVQSACDTFQAFGRWIGKREAA